LFDHYINRLACDAGLASRLSFATRSDRGRDMIAGSNSNIAWHRVQLKKNRDALKALEIARFRIGVIAGSAGERRQKAIASLKRKIAESERCIAAHDRQTRRPLATDLRSLTNVSWSSWNTVGLS
jgi:hypothetical protein